MKEEQNKQQPAEREQPRGSNQANAQQTAAPHEEEPHWSHGDRSDCEEMDAINRNDDERANGFREK